MGRVVSARIVVAAARGLFLHSDRARLVEFGGHVELNTHWAQLFTFITSKSKHMSSNFQSLKESYLSDVVTTFKMEDVPIELVLNWNQTSSNWTMDKCGVKHVEMIGVDNKDRSRQFFCGSVLGNFLPIQLIYKEKTNRCHPKFKFPAGWHVTHSPKHLSCPMKKL